MSPSRIGRSLIVCLFFCLAWKTAAAAEPSRVVVIGFDGADARLVEQYIDQGHLPNLKNLREAGGYSRLRPTNPPQTPVSWSAFATGKNPGKTGIFDFLNRSPGQYTPTLAFTTETRRPFLWGERNAPYLGALVGSASALFVAGLLLLLRARKVTSAAAGLVLGLLAGWGAHGVAAANLPEEVPWAVNNRQGRTLWEIVADQGEPTQVIRVPQNFPAQQIERGRILCGLGVPDMRGLIGEPTYYTSEPGFHVDDNEFSVEVVALAANQGTIQSAINGPPNKPYYDYRIDRARSAAHGKNEQKRAEAEMKRLLEERGVPRRLVVPVTFTVPPDGSTVTIEMQGKSQTLRPGEWSEWTVIDFPMNWLVDSVKPLRGIARWKVLATRPDLRIYLSPLNFHPESQPIPFSHPAGFASDLAGRVGLFKTIGWAEDTWSLPTGLVSDEFFVEDMTRTVDEFQRIMEAQLQASRDRLFVQVFDFTDRIGHMFWRYMDKDHPFHDPANDPAHVEAMRGEMLKAYQRMDAIVGRARELAGPEALFIVLSDHGFGSFRKGMNYNSWLVENGFMTVVGDAGETKTLEDLFETRIFFEKVDWARTKAYALGLGGIYVNLAGREPRGSVQPGAEYEQVRSAIIAGLEAAVDPATGQRPVRKVYTREEMYAGFDPTVIPDLRVGNDLGYRIGWQTALGQVPRHVYEDNLKAWSGDHCSLDPAVVEGILFVNRPLARRDPHIVDVMPTILKEMGIAVPGDVDGKPFL